MNRPQLSLVIPAYNEEGSIADTIIAFHTELQKHDIVHEILIVDDHSQDHTAQIVQRLKKEIASINYQRNTYANGFGWAVRYGLDHFRGEYVAIVMADLSDSPRDLIRMYQQARVGYDCVFGTRFHPDAKVQDYPLFKLILNRLTNNLIRILFLLSYNDVSNAFKMYSRDTIAGMRPFISHHFNLTVELPLKAIIRGYSYAVVPTDWTNRKAGVSKLKIREMASRYFFIIFYCWLEKHLAQGDYRKRK